MSPCIVRQATAEELEALKNLKPPVKEQHTDKRGLFRRRDKNCLKLGGSGWIRN